MARLRPSSRSRSAGLPAVAVAVLVLTVGLARPADATPPDIPSKATAQAELNSLPVAAEGSMTGYSRDLFPHWITISGALQHPRDRAQARRHVGRGQQLVRGDVGPVVQPLRRGHLVGGVRRRHRPRRARWPRRGGRVPVRGPRAAGRASPTTSAGPQLIAVTDNVNQAKGDKDPSAWQPPLTSYRCTYSKMWIHTKCLLGTPAPVRREVRAAGHAQHLLVVATCKAGPMVLGDAALSDHVLAAGNIV